jgi:glycosyltransferase involved in cell wall biosynthesis
MKILVVTFYFPPDLCAGSFRAGPLVDALAAEAPQGTTIDVVTTLPNRYSSFSAEAPRTESRGAVSITRFALPVHRSGFVDQSKSFISFARDALTEVSGRSYDIVVATSSRLMTAVLGAFIARRTGAELYLDIRDIFVETISDVGPRGVTPLMVPAFTMLEGWAIRRASRVNLVSRGFAPYFEGRYPGRSFSYLTNGIDDEFLTIAANGGSGDADATDLAGRVTVSTTGIRRVLYAGNIGESQGLHAIIPALARRMDGRCHFQIVGDGGRREALASQLRAGGVTNVELIAPLPRRELIALYSAADVLFLHLNDHPAFTRVLPSKIFEYAALGKPIWAGVAGYAADFLRAEVENCAVFPPCDDAAGERAFDDLAMGATPRWDFLERYSRRKISRELARDILAIHRSGAGA